MTNISFLEEKLLQGQVILLDGATGTELEKRGVPMNSKAWSAEAILTHPEIVQSVHEEYIRAGVDVITANTFSTAPHVLEQARLGAPAACLGRSNGRTLCLFRARRLCVDGLDAGALWHG